MLGLFSLILTGRDLLFVSILLAVDSTVPEYFLRAFPENFISTVWPFFTKGAKVSGISTSTKRTEVSSKFNIIELCDTSISFEKSRLPIIPSKGVVMFLFFNFAITSPVLTFVLNLWVLIFHIFQY